MNNSTIKINYLEKCYQIVRLLTQRTSIFKLTEKTHNVFGIEEDDFIIKNGLNKNKALENELVKINSKINGIEKEIEDLINAIEPDLNEAPFDKLARQYKLSKDEKYIIIALFFSGTTEAIQYRDGQLSYRELLELLGYRPSHFIDKMQLMSNLIRYKLIDYHQSYHSHSIFDYEFYLTRKTLSQIIDEHNWFFNDDKESDVELIDDTTKSLKKTGILNVREPVMTFDQIVLDEIQRHEIEQAVCQMEKSNKLLTEWGFDQTIKYGKGVTMLFYGPPGTGKTATAEAIAQKLNKKIGIANYAQILDKWFGNAEKHLVKVFEEAKKYGCVLVFDEADALFGKRLVENQSSDRTYNLMTNIMMQEIERFDGLVILTTNRELAMDEAFERRILFKIKFDVPKAEERAKIWRALIPLNAPLADDVNFIELGKRFELTGGEIKNAILKVVRECSIIGAEKITMAILTKFAEKERAMTKRHSIKAVGFLR